MRIIIIISAFCLFFTANIANAMSTNEYVAALEQKLFGMTYQNQPLAGRIDRIEQQIYDNSYSGSPEERLSKIDKIYPKSEFEKKEMQPQNYNSNDISNDKWYTQDYPEPEEKADYNRYPIVSEIEQSIYKKDFQGEDIYKRLARLEKELYGNVKNEESLQNRVEALKSVLPKKHYNRFAAQDFGFKNFGLNTPSEYNMAPNNSEYFDTNSIVRELERETFNKSYDDDQLERRLDRLESFYFGGISTGQDKNDRINRLASVVLNGKMRDTGMQIPRGAQWAGILMNLLVIGLGFLL